MALALTLSGAVAAPAPVGASAQKMDCGSAPLCGVLTLETGLGSGYYRHDAVTVHGLWPEVGQYGTSKCIAPSDGSDPTVVHTCYEAGGTASHQLQFETHEWEKHGKCAGVQDEGDFFDQVCGLSSAPLKVMAAAKAKGHTDLQGYAQVLTGAGYPVFSTDSENMQVMLSACAASDGKWKLASTSDFGSECGGYGLVEEGRP